MFITIVYFLFYSSFLELNCFEYMFDEEVLYNKIFDPTNPGDPITAMPAFGRNGWLSDEEIKAVVAYLKTIN